MTNYEVKENKANPDFSMTLWMCGKWDSPVEIWMKPKRMMMIRASNLEAVNKSWTLVAALTLIQFTNVREATGGGGIQKRVKSSINHL